MTLFQIVFRYFFQLTQFFTLPLLTTWNCTERLDNLLTKAILLHPPNNRDYNLIYFSIFRRNPTNLQILSPSIDFLTSLVPLSYIKTGYLIDLTWCEIGHVLKQLLSGFSRWACVFLCCVQHSFAINLKGMICYSSIFQ